MMNRFKQTLIGMLALLLSFASELFAQGSSDHVSAKDHKINLLVISTPSSEEWQVDFTKSLYDELSSQLSSSSIHLYNEVIGYDVAERVLPNEIRQSVVVKYSSIAPSYVLVMGNLASSAMADLKSAWPEATILHVVDTLDVRMKSNATPTPHVVIDLDPLASVLALEGMMEIDHLYFIANTPPKGAVISDFVKRGLAKQLPNLPTSWLLVDDLQDALPELQQAPPNSAAFLVYWQPENDFFVGERRRAIYDFANQIPMPLLGMTSHDVGYGVLGGWVIEPTKLAQSLARLLLKMDNLPWRSYLPRRDVSEWVFDANRVDHWGVEVGIVGEPITWRQPPLANLEDLPQAILWRWGLTIFAILLLMLSVLLFFVNRRKAFNLQELNDELTNLITATDVGAWRWNVSTGEVRFNERWANMIGYQLEELQPISIRTWEHFTHPDDLVESDRALQAHFRGETPVYQCEVRMRHKHGHWVWVFDSGQVMQRNEKGEPIMMYGIHLDINERKQLEIEFRKAKLQAEHASNAKSHFLSNMSHEIRTPTHGILGVLEILKSEKLDERQLALVKGGMASARALLAVLGDILDFSKIESGKLELDIQPMDMADFVEDLRLLGESLTGTKQVEFDISLIPIEGARLQGDITHLRQIMINLIGNAIKFTEHGYVKVRVECTEEQDSQVRCDFSVSDTGMGIPANMLDKIFEGFEQVHNQQKTSLSGTGLGLTIASELVRLMGGKIHVVSEVDVGSTFSFSIVLKQASPANLMQDEVDDSAHSLQGLHFLLVEDSPTNQMIAKAIIESFGGVCTVTNNGAEAIMELREKPDEFDMVLMDLRMPVMDGYTATRNIREEISDTLPIVALSANVSPEDREKSLKVGMQGHLGKPFVPKDLLSMLGGILQPKKLLETPEQDSDE